MINWVNFLHIYQPPTQTKETAEKVVRESYELICNLLEKYPSLKITLNINGTLTEQLLKHGHLTIIKKLGEASQRGQIEFVGSAMYHPILPLIPEKEVIHQIKLNEKINKETFGESYKPNGFFLPEMAYSPKIGKIIKTLGYKWIILDEIHTSIPVDRKTKYTNQDGLIILFRNTKISKHFPPEFIFNNKDNLDGQNIITAHDGELYGHWHTDDRGFYEKTFTNTDIHTILASQYIDSLTKEESVITKEANWESTNIELEKKIYFGLWAKPENEIQQKLWQYANHCYKVVTAHQKDTGHDKAHKYLSRGLASCYWWWASEVKIGPFSPQSWNPTEIDKGAQELLNSIKDLESLTQKDKEELEKEYLYIKDIVWKKHWTEYDKKTNTI